MNKRVTKLHPYVLLSAYIGIIAIFVTSIIALPKWMNIFEKNYIEKIESELFTTIQNTPLPKLEETLQELYEQSVFEIAVNQKDKTIIRTIPGDDFNSLRGTINKNAIVAETQGIILHDSGEHLDVWYVIYRPLLQDYLSNYTILQIAVLMFAFLVLITVILLVQKITIKPLEQLKTSLSKLEKYEFDTFPTEGEDVLNDSVQRFAMGLEKNIEVVMNNHTQLEQALQLERERLTNLLTISRGLIHDFKTPLHQTLVENDILVQKSTTKEAKITAELNVQKMDKLLLQVNDILNMLDTDVEKMLEVKNDFDIVPMFKKIRETFKTEFQENNLYLNAEYSEKIEVHLNKVALHLVLHNMFSNVAKYAIADSDIDFSMFTENNLLYITMENQTLPQNIERIENSHNLFNIVEDNNTYMYSTGNGIYLIKELAKIMHGTYMLEIVENLVVLQVVIPLMEDDYE